MVFSSQTFLFFFLPLAGLCVFVRSKPLQNTLLLMASFLFYAWGEPKMVVLMALVTLVAYLSGFAMVHFEGQPGPRRRSWWRPLSTPATPNTMARSCIGWPPSPTPSRSTSTSPVTAIWPSAWAGCSASTS